MRRGKARARKVRADAARAASRIVDATPERLAKSEHSEIINPALIDSSEQPIGRVRRFRDSWIDRMYRRDQLTYAQWFACGWYRDLHAAAFTAPRVVADYGQGAGGAGSGNYGQAFNEAQQRKRVLFRHAREHIPALMLALVEDLVLRDTVPALAGGAQRKRFASRIAKAIQPLAAHIAAPGWHLYSAAEPKSVLSRDAAQGCVDVAVPLRPAA